MFDIRADWLRGYDKSEDICAMKGNNRNQWLADKI